MWFPARNGEIKPKPDVIGCGGGRRNKGDTRRPSPNPMTPGVSNRCGVSHAAGRPSPNPMSFGAAGDAAIKATRGDQAQTRCHWVSAIVVVSQTPGKNIARTIAQRCRTRLRDEAKTSHATRVRHNPCPGGFVCLVPTTLLWFPPRFDKGFNPKP